MYSSKHSICLNSCYQEQQISRNVLVESRHDDGKLHHEKKNSLLLSKYQDLLVLDINLLGRQRLRVLDNPYY